MNCIHPQIFYALFHPCNKKNLKLRNYFQQIHKNQSLNYANQPAGTRNYICPRELGCACVESLNASGSIDELLIKILPLRAEDTRSTTNSRQ